MPLRLVLIAALSPERRLALLRARLISSPYGVVGGDDEDLALDGFGAAGVDGRLHR